MAELLKPKLKYLFCIANARSLWPQLSLMKYLNVRGVIPYVVIQDAGMTPQGWESLKGVEFQRIVNAQAFPKDYDVMLSQSSGLDEYERVCLEKSWALKKTNIKVHNSMSTYNRLVNINYVQSRIKGRLHGIVMKEHRAVEHFRRFLTEKDCWILNTGDPDWDYLATEECNIAINNYRQEYGEKVLLILASFDAGSAEIQFWKTVIPWATAMGFVVHIRTHPGCEHRFTPDLLKYKAPDIHRHVIFAGASHAIGEMASSVIGECMLVHTKVGSYPFVPHTPKYGVHSWIDHDTLWREAIVKQVGAEMLSYVPYVHTKASLEKFLGDKMPLITNEQMDKLWGWPRVPNYCEHFFSEVERKLGC